MNDNLYKLAQMLVRNGFRAETIRQIMELNGGKGSGNWGHAGRPGKVGGSLAGSGGKGRSGKSSSTSASERLRNSASKQQIKEAENTAKVGLRVDPLEVETEGIGKGMTKQAIVGVAGKEIPEKVPRLNGITEEQKEIENQFAELWEDPEKREQAIATLREKFTSKDGSMTIETDAVKELDPRWGDKQRIKDLQNKKKAGTITEEERRELDGYLSFQQRNNTVLHQTANVLAKETLRREIEARKSRGEEVNLLVTSGGCAVGKGFGLEELGRQTIRDNTPDKSLVDDYNARTTPNRNMIIWDSAGDQNATELPWVASQNVDHVTFVHTVGDGAKNASNTKSGLVQRAVDKGRMVDANVYAQSYWIGNYNFQVFYDNNSTNPKFSFFKVENPGKGNGPTRLIDPSSTSGFDKSGLTANEAIRLIEDNLATNPTTSSNSAMRNDINSGAQFIEDLIRKL